jgi:hypothetical protein
MELLCYTEEEFQGRAMELGMVVEAAKVKELV